jgi:hypothetical protein
MLNWLKQIEQFKTAAATIKFRCSKVSLWW